MLARVGSFLASPSEFTEIQLATLADLKRAGYRLYGNCYCGRGRELDLGMLIERYGEDYVFVNEHRIQRSLRCNRCGHPGGKLTLQPG